jgi:hypothetical protein
MARNAKRNRSAARATGKKVLPPKMPEPDDFTIICDGKDLYLAADGVKIAKWSKGRTWISLEPGWRIADDPESITIEFSASRVQ